MLDEDKKDYVKTSDLNLTSTLLALGHTVSGSFIEESGRAQFYFDKSPEIENLIQLYFAKKLKVEPFDLFHARSEVIARIKGDRRI